MDLFAPRQRNANGVQTAPTTTDESPQRCSTAPVGADLSATAVHRRTERQAHAQLSRSRTGALLQQRTNCRSDATNSGRSSPQPFSHRERSSGHWARQGAIGGSSLALNRPRLAIAALRPHSRQSTRQRINSVSKRADFGALFHHNLPLATCPNHSQTEPNRRLRRLRLPRRLPEKGRLNFLYSTT